MLHLPLSAQGCSPSILAPGRMLSWENSQSPNTLAVRGQLVLGSPQRGALWCRSSAVLTGGAVTGLTRPG